MNVVSIGLTVFGPNRAAQSLYEDLGFEVTVLQMRKHPSMGLTLLGPGEHGYVAVTIADNEPPVTANRRCSTEP
jgi:ribosomal protein S18 acetylase RimI-like enzyme